MNRTTRLPEAASQAISEAKRTPSKANDLLPPSSADRITLSLEPLNEIAIAPRLSYPVPAAFSPAEGLELPDRYTYQKSLGRGGMGEVHRVYDRYLNRAMALKVLRSQWVGSQETESRFLAEAQATAQLQHPGIVPVFDIGKLSDGRYYFTMKEVNGLTLEAVIQEVHDASPGDIWLPSSSGWSFRRLLDAFLRVCEAMAYAHERGVVHRDLKPANLMVGRFGEVLVMDWGLARVQGSAPLEGIEAELRPIQTVRTREGIEATRLGKVAGTLAYMPPEQARGEISRLGPASDVYSLGAVLYEILCGQPPFQDSDEWALLEQVRSARWRRPERYARISQATATETEGASGRWNDKAAVAPLSPGPPLPEELIQICQQAMLDIPEARFPNAAALADAVRAWLEQARRRERGLEAVGQVRSLPDKRKELRCQAESLRARATNALKGVPTWAPEDQKHAGWELEDAAREVDQQADAVELAYIQGLRGALAQDPDLLEAHQLLTAYYHGQHVEAESRRDERAAAQAEMWLRTHDRRREYASYLTGDGAVSLVTEPIATEVELYRYEPSHRRLIPVFQCSLGQTPLRKVSLRRGSYLLKLHAPGCMEVNYPVFIERGQHWDGVPPEGGGPIPISLPRKGELGPQDCYVPAGWFWAGGDPMAPSGLDARRVWVNGLVIRKFQVTNREYVRFLNELLAQGDKNDALRWAPRERTATLGQDGELIYGIDPSGKFILRPDADGDMWDPEWPVICIDWFSACAFTTHVANQQGKPWRLPGELEWEKAARGVDGRVCPWGDFLEPSWACYRDSFPSRWLPAVVESFPVDESVYGVRGMAGNIMDWCLDVFRREGPIVTDRSSQLLPLTHDLTSSRTQKGGCFIGLAGLLRVAARAGVEPLSRISMLGFRFARSYP